MTTVECKRPVPVSEWGKDHWSTLTYAEVRAVDHRGRIGKEHMRCDAGRHPLLVSSRVPNTGRKYPTFLYGGVELEDHDDWDCLADAEAAGFITISGLPEGLLNVEPGRRGKIHPQLRRKKNSLGYEWNGNPKVAFTDEGLRVVALVRAHKTQKGSFGTFRLED